MPKPQVLVVAPPPFGAPQGPIAPKFEGGGKKCVGLARAYKQICDELGCHFFDAGSVITSSNVDGVHLDAAQHLTLGHALSRLVAPLLNGAQGV
jgi:hypothetical protein